jgi:hypothetical protein
VGKQDVFLQKIGDRQVGGVLTVGVDRHVSGFLGQVDTIDDLCDSDTGPDVVELAPPRYAVEIRPDINLREGREFVPGPFGFCRHFTEYTEAPAVGVHSGCSTVSENRKLCCKILIGWYPSFGVFVGNSGGIRSA